MGEAIHQRVVRQLKAADAQIRKLERRIDEAQLLQLRVDSAYYNGKIKELEARIEQAIAEWLSEPPVYPKNDTEHIAELAERGMRVVRRLRGEE